jgi:hypothetical protein
MSFRLIPPPSSEFRTYRLLASTLDNVHRLARGHRFRDWNGRIQGRLVVMPDSATPLQRAQLLAALLVGDEIIRLRDSEHLFGARSTTEIDATLGAIARGDSANAIACLVRLDGMLSGPDESAAMVEIISRTRAGILALTEVLTDHAAFFGGENANEVH